MYSIYALYSPAYSKIYVGFTSNLEERLLSHNQLAKKGYTIRYRPWVLIYSESYKTKKMAMAREKQLKSAKGREFIWGIVNKA